MNDAQQGLTWGPGREEYLPKMIDLTRLFAAHGLVVGEEEGGGGWPLKSGGVHFYEPHA